MGKRRRNIQPPADPLNVTLTFTGRAASGLGTHTSPVGALCPVYKEAPSCEPAPHLGLYLPVLPDSTLWFCPHFLGRKDFKVDRVPVGQTALPQSLLSVCWGLCPSGWCLGIASNLLLSPESCKSLCLHIGRANRMHRQPSHF